LVRWIIVAVLLNTSLFGKNFVEVIPANINYKNESLADFSEYLYEAFQNAIAEYNYKQNSVETMVILKENTTPELKNKHRTVKFHSEVKKDAIAYINRRDLKNLIVLDFNSKKVAKALSRCKYECSISVNANLYNRRGVKDSKYLYLTYNGKAYLFNKKSKNAINSTVFELLVNNGF